MSSMEPKELDTILGLQLSVAWAGEKAGEPQRLNWWNTDLTDEAAGGDFFERLLARTAAWAGLELAREAAIRADRAARAALARPDRTWTLFHFGFALDEAIRDRLEHHKRHGRNPKEVLVSGWSVTRSWDREAFEVFLKGLGNPKTKETPAGRKLSAKVTDAALAARDLAAALLPLSDMYPLPHCDMPVHDMPAHDISPHSDLPEPSDL
jgi:hypothetical protein